MTTTEIDVEVVDWVETSARNEGDSCEPFSQPKRAANDRFVDRRDRR